LGRHKKTGLDWFQHDTDLSNDEKMEALEALYGNDGYATYNKLLERIYRQAGQLDISDTEMVQVIAKKCNVDLERFDKILQFCLKIGLFDKKIFEDKKILTSDGIKKRVKPVLKKRQTERDKHTSKSATEKVQKKVISDSETDIVEESIVEKSKVKNIIIKSLNDLPEIPERIPSKAFKDYIEMRITLNKKITMRAVELMFMRLEKFKNLGINLEDVLNTSTENSYTGLFAPNKSKGRFVNTNDKNNSTNEFDKLC
jgi:hypothetical protein